MLLRWHSGTFIMQRAKRRDNTHTGLMRSDNLIHIPQLGGLVRVQNLFLILLNQLRTAFLNIFASLRSRGKITTIKNIDRTLTIKHTHLGGRPRHVNIGSQGF